MTAGTNAGGPSGLPVSPPIVAANDKDQTPPFPSRIPREGFPHQAAQPGGKLPSTKENVAHLLAASGVDVSYDVIKKRLHISEGAIERTYSDLISLANLNGQNAPWFGDFVLDIGRGNPCNPVAHWIASKPWDGTDRLEALFNTVQTDDDFPDKLKRLLLGRWLLSAVAGATISDFRTRGVLTLQGPQGCGKTSWIARLVPPDLQKEFVKLDHYLDPHNKDSVFIGISHWITEIGELDSSFKKDIARLKGFLTNDCDKLRKPYAKNPVEMDRKTVFAASVNETRFLIDQTGNSRFWTLPVLKLDYEHTIDMQQLYAQLAVEVANGAKWWLIAEEEALLEEHNDRFKAVSVIEERLLEHLESEGDTVTPRFMTPIEVLRAVGFNSPSNQQCRECGGILRSRFGAPKRINGRERWKVPLRPTEQTWSKPYDPAQDEY